MQGAAPKPLHIGPLAIDPPLLLAPMAGFTDWAFRQLVRRLGGAGLLTTEMVSARGLYFGTLVGPGLPDATAGVNSGRRQRNPADAAGRLPLRLWGVAREPRPLAVQIWDNDPAKLAAVGAWLARELKASLIDLNFGCPVRNVAERAESGSYLLRYPQRVGQIVARVAAACAPVPVTAKIRLGPDRDTNTAGDVARAVEDAGAAALTVHGRTAADLFRGRADWEQIARIKPHLRRIPLVGNGDLRSAADVVAAFARYGVDGVMIGRAALGRPWLFRQAAAALAGLPPVPEPTLAEQRRLLLEHFELAAGQYGAQRATVLMRRCACRYAQGQAGARAFRAAVAAAATREQFLQAVDRLFPEADAAVTRHEPDKA